MTQLYLLFTIIKLDLLSQRWIVKCFDDFHNHGFIEQMYCGMLPKHRKMSDSDILQMNNL